MFEITVEKEFAAAHRLREYNGNCEKLHGHNWRVELTLRTDRLNELGLAVDFRDAKRLLSEMLALFDHQYLNDLQQFKSENPSCERIAQCIYDGIRNQLIDAPSLSHIRVSRVRVWESPGSSVTYREDNQSE
ncbi:6-carboxytetrahydropterin synthase QueD [bacterium]|nr:6-carboxytetrahydropterin synthase QueD [candidate division CSSED10-310 bacterium]